MAELEPCPAISLWQPWASLLFFPATLQPVKVHETRDYRPPAKYLGHTIAIHAAQKKPDHNVVDHRDPLADICEQAWGQNWRRELPLGAVIGFATLASAFQMEGENFEAKIGELGGPASMSDFHAGAWVEGRWAWRMAYGRELRRPVPATGKRGWFTVNLDPRAR